MRVAAAVTPPAAAAAVVIATAAQIQTVTIRRKARRERKRARRKIPVGTRAPRPNNKSRVREGPLLTGAGHGVLATDPGGLKRSRGITGNPRQRGEAAGVDMAARREVRRDGDTAAETDRGQAAPDPIWQEAGVETEAGRTEVQRGVTAEMLRGTDTAQMDGEAEQRLGGAGAGKGEEKEVGVGREEKVVQTEVKENTDFFVFVF